MDNRAYWIWLQHAFGAGSAKPWQIHRRFHGGAEEFYAGKTPLWNAMEFVSEKEARMLSTFSLLQAEVVLEMCEKLGHQVFTPLDKEYPEPLKNIFNPPAVLYCRGKIPDVEQTPAIAMVGTRKALPKSIDAATTISYQLAMAGAVVISGGALGVDSAAHKGAMRGMGKTIAVLPCGLTNGYLVENYALRERIAENGALVTEYPIDTGVTKGTFQIRNRLISGLGCASLIVEAQNKSGAMITARHAKEQDRDVFVYIGEPDSPRFSGCTSLLQDGAKAVTCGEEILEEYALRFSPRKKEKKKVMQTRVPAAVPVLADIEGHTPLPSSAALPDAMRVLAALKHEPTHISEIEKLTGLAPAKILAALTQLELGGSVQGVSGRRYTLK